METINFVYAIMQIAHNFGASIVIGGSFFSYWYKPLPSPTRKKLAWAVMIGWLIQGLSGAGFGVTSYVFHGHLPEIHGVAKISLFIKILCTMIGLVLSMSVIFKRETWGEKYRNLIWGSMLTAAATALFAAAVLRWFS